jgi:hypothetical protein
MKQKYLPLLFMVLCGILVLAAGCTSPVPGGNHTATPTATVTPVASARDALKDLALSPQDLPPGYSLVYRGEMRPGDPNCTASACFLQGYFISASNGTDNTSTVINQAIVIYDVDATPDSLGPVLTDQLRDLSSNLTTLPDPDLGDASAFYRFERPDYGDGYLLIFGKGNVYEIIMVWGPDASESMVIDLAKKALD